MNLKKILYLYLYDTMDTCDLQPDSEDKEFIDKIIKLMADKNINKVFCIFKNYELYDKCEFNKECDKDSLGIHCKRKPKNIIRRFIKLHRGGD